MRGKALKKNKLGEKINQLYINNKNIDYPAVDQQRRAAVVDFIKQLEKEYPLDKSQKNHINLDALKKKIKGFIYSWYGSAELYEELSKGDSNNRLIILAKKQIALLMIDIEYKDKASLLELYILARYQKLMGFNQLYSVTNVLWNITKESGKNTRLIPAFHEIRHLEALHNKDQKTNHEVKIEAKEPQSDNISQPQPQNTAPQPTPVESKQDYLSNNNDTLSYLAAYQTNPNQLFDDIQKGCFDDLKKIHGIVFFFLSAYLAEQIRGLHQNTIYRKYSLPLQKLFDGSRIFENFKALNNIGLLQVFFIEMPYFVSDKYEPILKRWLGDSNASSKIHAVILALCAFRKYINQNVLSKPEEVFLLSTARMLAIKPSTVLQTEVWKYFQKLLRLRQPIIMKTSTVGNDIPKSPNAAMQNQNYLLILTLPVSFNWNGLVQSSSFFHQNSVIDLNQEHRMVTHIPEESETQVVVPISYHN